MIKKSVAVEYHARNIFLLARLSEQLSDLLRRRHSLGGLELALQRRRQRRDRDKRNAFFIGDNLRVNVLDASIDADPRAQIGSPNLFAHPLLASVTSDFSPTVQHK